MTTSTPPAPQKPAAIPFLSPEEARAATQGPTPLLLVFSAPWCGPCKGLEPALQTLQAEYGEALTVARLDVDQYPEMIGEYGVRGVPVSLVFRGGVEVARVNGLRPATEFTRHLG